MSALLGPAVTAGLSAVNLGLTWGKTIPVGSYEVGAHDQADNPVRMEEVSRSYALADTPTTNAQLAAALRQLEGRTTVLMAQLPKHRWAIVARGTVEELREIKKAQLGGVVASMVSQKEVWNRVGDLFVKGGLEAFNLSNAPTRIVPVTLEAHLPAGFENPNQPALTNPLEASAIAALLDLELPTGVEWEVASAELGDDKYRDKRELRRVAHFYPAEPRSTSDVKLKEPNQYGLYDMLGNVWEVMANPYEEGKENREFRGGSWSDGPELVRAALRYNGRPGRWSNDRGFRLLCPQDFLTGC